MSLRAAMMDKFLTASPDDNVEAVLKGMKKAKAETAAVIDDSGKTLGVFSLQILMKNLLPVSVAMSGGIHLDVKVAAAPGIAKRLNKIHSLKISDVMERKFVSVDPETPLWEAVNQLVNYGSPLLVVDSASGNAVGMITSQSALDELTKMKDSE